MKIYSFPIKSLKSFGSVRIFTTTTTSRGTWSLESCFGCQFTRCELKDNVSFYDLNFLILIFIDMNGYQIIFRKVFSLNVEDSLNFRMKTERSKKSQNGPFVFE